MGPAPPAPLASPRPVVTGATAGVRSIDYGPPVENGPLVHIRDRQKNSKYTYPIYDDACQLYV